MSDVQVAERNLNEFATPSSLRLMSRSAEQAGLNVPRPLLDLAAARRLFSERPTDRNVQWPASWNSTSARSSRHRSSCSPFPRPSASTPSSRGRCSRGKPPNPPITTAKSSAGPLQTLFEYVIQVATQATEYSERTGKASQRPAWQVVEIWANVQRSGGSNGSHAHPGSFWSGVYYVDAGDISEKGKNAENCSSSIPEAASRACWRPICVMRFRNCTTPATPSPSRLP